jgi:hypothetical protein
MAPVRTRLIKVVIVHGGSIGLLWAIRESAYCTSDPAEGSRSDSLQYRIST